MRIVFAIPHFAQGGAERVASILCNAWAQQGHTVTAVTFEAPGDKQLYALGQNVNLYQISAINRSSNIASRLLTNARRLNRLRAIFRSSSPHVIVAFTTEMNVIALLSAYGLGIPVVVSERNQPDRPGLGPARRAARRLTYPMAAAIVMQTRKIAEWAEHKFEVPVHVIPNPVHLGGAVRRGRGAAGDKQIVAAGRLVKQKGFDLLVASFAEVAPKYPDWKLLICGEGPERGRLETLVRNVSLSDRVLMPGICNNMDKVLANATFFVLPSRFEGYSNVTLEALAAGCPVVATDCPGANAEILHGQRYGLLVPTEDKGALAEALDRMMSDVALRGRYAATAAQAVQHLDVDVIASRWLKLLSMFRRP
jgi:glycosyltransferase involved in cell wall biosynthesis